MKRWLEIATSVAMCAVLGLGPASGQDEDDVVTLEASLVDVRAVVTDAGGRPVAGLTASDFEVLESGAPQQIEFFSLERVGAAAERASARVGEEATPSAERAAPSATAATGDVTRTLVLLVDTLHMAPETLIRTREALTRFVDEQVGDGDLVAIVATDGSLGALSQFTRDRSRMRLAIDRLSGVRAAGASSYYKPYVAALVLKEFRDAAGFASNIVQAEEGYSFNAAAAGASPTTPQGQLAESQARLVGARAKHRAFQVLAEAEARRRATLSTLQAVSDRMADLPGQRAVALFTDGFSLYGTGGSIDTTEIRAATTRAVRSGVVIFPIMARGLETDPLLRADAPLGFDPQGRYRQLARASVEDLADAPNALAKDTGGEVIRNRNDLDRALAGALAERQLYYRLAYYAPEREGEQFREITIRVKGHPEYTVRAHRGYYAIPEAREAAPRSAEERLFLALARPLPYPDFDVSVSADYIESASDEAQVTVGVDIDASQVTFTPSGEKLKFDLEVGIAVFGSGSDPVFTTYDEVAGKQVPEAVEASKQNGFRYRKRVALEPGSYQVRVGVRERSSDRIGTAATWIEVPKIEKGRLVASSLVLNERVAGDEQFVQPRAVSGIRTLGVASQLVYYLQLYGAREVDAVRMRVEILRDGEPVHASGWEPIASHTIDRTRKGVGVGGIFDLAAFGPGLYELRVAVREGEKQKAAERAAAFQVLPK